MNDSTLRLRVRPRTAAWVLAAIIGCLLAAHLVGQVAKHWLGRDNLLGFVPLFDMDAERSIPTWFSSFELLFAAGLLLFIAWLQRSTGRRFWVHWAGLGALFAFMSLDEMVSIHERWLPVRVGGLAVPPTLPLAVVLFFVFVPFVLHLPRRTALLFVIAGMVFVGGAAGMEMVEASYVRAAGGDNLGHSLSVAVEETMEMSGLALFIFALLGYLGAQFGAVQLRFGPEGAPADATGSPAPNPDETAPAQSVTAGESGH